MSGRGEQRQLLVIRFSQVLFIDFAQVAMYTRAAASDYDDWETIYGNSGWGSKDLIPLLKKVLTYKTLSTSPKLTRPRRQKPTKVNLTPRPTATLVPSRSRSAARTRT